jgi:hypothetical protein
MDAAKLAKEAEIAVQTALRTQAVGRALTAVSNFRLLAVGSQIAVTAGPLAIAAAGSILMSIAIDQFMEIVMARDKLNSALEIAKQPADLKALLEAPDGHDQLAYLWSKAIDGTPPPDRDIQQLAASALAAAKNANYKLPTTAPPSK